MQLVQVKSERQVKQPYGHRVQEPELRTYPVKQTVHSTGSIVELQVRHPETRV